MFYLKDTAESEEFCMLCFWSEEVSILLLCTYKGATPHPRNTLSLFVSTSL